MDHDKLIAVGEYIEAFNQATDQSLPCGIIYQSIGLEKHILDRHPEQIDNLKYIPDIIRRPDYIGKNPNEENSIELIKTIGDNIQVCVKLDLKHNYLYVASTYPISESKLKNRLNSGRLQIFIDKNKIM